MATFTFNADSSEVTGTSGVTKVGTTYQMNGTSAQIDIIADAGGGMALDHSTALESKSAWEPNPSSVSAWYDADDASTITESGGDISSWADKSDEGNDLTEATNKPSYVSGQMGGKPVVRFDGTEGLSGALKAGLTSATLFVVQNTADSKYIVVYDSASYAYSADNTSSTFVNGAFGSPSYYATGVLQNWTDRQVVLNALNNTPSVVCALNCDMSVWPTLSLGLYGFDFDFSGDVAEIIVVPSALSTADRELYEGYLAWKWGMEANLPSGHPYESSAPVAPAIDYDYTDDIGATNYVNAGNIAALQGVTDTDFQNEKFRLNLTGVAGGLWNSFIIQNYNADVIAPADPTGAKATDAEVWGMWWVQSPEGSTIIAQLKRIIDGTTTYLAKVANLPVWQEASPTTWWTFARDNTGADTPFNAFETDDVAGTAIAYYVRFVDLSDNVSSWVSFTESAGGFTPATPALDSVSVGDGSITFNVTPNAETDEVFARVRRNSPAYTWEDKSESFKRTGSGAITVTGLINGIEYECAAQTMDGGILGTGSDFGGSRFAMPDSDAFAVSRYNEKLNERNGTARVNWEVARRRGVKVTFKNGPDADAVVYAKVAQPSTVTIGVRTGQIDRSDIVISVPRQTNFPPSQFYPNATFTLNTKSYQIDNVDFDNEDINMTAVFVLTASVLGIEDGY